MVPLGVPGPDRGLGGKYLLLPPGYDGKLPEGGYSIGRPTHHFRRATRAGVAPAIGEGR